MIELRTTRYVEETEAIGEELGRRLEAGDFVALVGDLGAGKTAFVRGLARGLGVPPEAQVSSPTFAIVNAYQGGRLPLLHADLYRVKDAEELYDAGWYDLLESGGAFVVEWFDRVPEASPPEWLEIRFEKIHRGRELTFIGHGARGQALLSALRNS